MPVNRGELFSMWLALSTTDGAGTKMITDSSYAMNRRLLDESGGRADFHLDLWGRMAKLKEDRQPWVTHKVKSHRSLEEVLKSGQCVTQWLGNQVADMLAKFAANRGSVKPETVAEIEQLDIKVGLVQRRLAAIVQESAAREAEEKQAATRKANQDHRDNLRQQAMAAEKARCDEIDRWVSDLGAYDDPMQGARPPDPGGDDFVDEEAVARDWFDSPPEDHNEDEERTCNINEDEEQECLWPNFEQDWDAGSSWPAGEAHKAKAPDEQEYDALFSPDVDEEPTCKIDEDEGQDDLWPNFEQEWDAGSSCPAGEAQPEAPDELEYEALFSPEDKQDDLEAQAEDTVATEVPAVPVAQHTIVRTAGLLSYCATCRWAGWEPDCRWPAACGGHLAELPLGGFSIGSHNLVVLHSGEARPPIVACMRCGAWTMRRARRLAGTVCIQDRKGKDSLSRLRRGLVPWTGTRRPPGACGA